MIDIQTPDETSTCGPAPNFALRWPRFSAAGWLATVGAGLLFVASTVAVAGRWESLGPEVRFAALVSALIAVYTTAETTRRRIPTTATALAVLSAMLTAPVAIAVSAVAGAAWPTSILVGGVTSLLAAEIAAVRWRVSSLKASTLVSFALAASGLAVLADVPVTIIGGGGAIASLLVGARRRALALAVAVVATPLTAALADAGIGRGTIPRLGIDADDGWLVLALALSAVVIAHLAVDWSNDALALVAVAVVARSVTLGLDLVNADEQVVLALPGIVLLSLHALVALDRRVSNVFTRLAAAVHRPAVVTVAIASLLAPVCAFVVRSLARSFGTGTGLELSWIPAIAVTAVALIAARCMPGRPLWPAGRLDLLVLAVAALAMTAGVSAGLPDVVLASAHPLLWIAVTATTGWASWRRTTVPFVLGTLAFAAEQSPGVLAGFIAVATAMVVASWSASPSEVGRRVGVAVPTWIGVTWIAALLHQDLVAVVTACGALSVAVTGVAMAYRGFDQLDALALSLGGATLAVATGAPPVWISLSTIVVAAEAVLFAAAWGRRRLAGAPAAVGCAGVLSLWWTTGTNAAAIDLLAPLGITGTDIAVVAAAVALIGVGEMLRTRVAVSSWLSSGPGLGLVVTWLLTRQTDVDGDWATVAGMAVGVVAVAIGGVARRAAPLVGGTALLAGTVIFSAEIRLESAPTWAWIAGGGVALLVLAGLVERTERPLVRSRGDQQSVVEQFCSTFR